MTAEAFAYVDESVSYDVVGFESGIRQYHAFRCTDAEGGDALEERYFTIQHKRYSTDEWDPACSTRVHWTCPVNQGLSLAELDVEEKTDAAIVAAGKAAAEAKAKEIESENRAARKADIWAAIEVGVQVAVCFVIDGEPQELRGIVRRIGRGVHAETREEDDFFEADFEDDQTERVYRMRDDYRVLEAHEHMQLDQPESPPRTTRSGRAVRAPAREDL
jgi:hypothetical protein